MLINDFIGSEKSKPAVVCGSAPSLSLASELNQSIIRIGVGDVPWRAPEFGPWKYWITANPIFPLPWIKGDLLKIIETNAILLLSSASVANCVTNLESNLNFLHEDLVQSNTIFYDQRHFNNEFCSSYLNCCKFSKSLGIEKSIQEILGTLVGKCHPVYSNGSTVALHGLAFAIILGCNPIYLAGIELPARNENYKAYKNWKRPNQTAWDLIRRYLFQYIPFVPHSSTDFGTFHQEIIKDFQDISNVAKTLGVELISLSKTSPLNHVHGINFIENRVP